MGACRSSKTASEAKEVASSVISGGCGGYGIGIAFLLFLILILLVIGFSFWY